MTFSKDYGTAVLASLHPHTLPSKRLEESWQRVEAARLKLEADRASTPPPKEPQPSSYRCGLLFRLGSCWIGAHWSPYNRRMCINPVPCVTLWFTLPGGNTP